MQSSFHLTIIDHPVVYQKLARLLPTTGLGEEKEIWENFLEYKVQEIEGCVTKRN